MKSTNALPMPTGATPPHITTVNAARMLGMAVRSVQLMVDRGELQAWKTPGGHRRILRESVESWLSLRAAGRGEHRVSGENSATPVPVAPRPAAAATQDLRGRILLIEDSVHFQNLVGLVVRKHFPHAELHVASDGITGLVMFGEIRPDVLIVDILLPGIDGATLITSLRQHPRYGLNPIVVVTSLTSAERVPFALALDGVPVVHKPRLAADLPGCLSDAMAAGADRIRP